MKKYRSAVTNSHGDGKYSTGNILNNIVITMDGARWALDSSGGINL